MIRWSVKPPTVGRFSSTKNIVHLADSAKNEGGSIK
jgi:hypothetical protein